MEWKRFGVAWYRSDYSKHYVEIDEKYGFLNAALVSLRKDGVAEQGYEAIGRCFFTRPSKKSEDVSQDMAVRLGEWAPSEEEAVNTMMELSVLLNPV